MRKIAIEGLDGSGKTSVAYELANLYEQEGLHTQVVAPYRLVNEQLGTDIYPCWRSTNGAKVAIGLIRRVLEDVSVQAQDEDKDILIFDRHWMTAFTEIGGNDQLISAWGDSFVPTAYLRVDPETARARSSNDNQSTWMTRHNFNTYATKYETLCARYGQYLLGIYRNDNDVSISSIARNILWDMNIRR